MKKYDVGESWLDILYMYSDDLFDSYNGTIIISNFGRKLILSIDKTYNTNLFKEIKKELILCG